MMILSMDLGKFNTVCCLYDTRNRKYSFQTIATKRSHIDHLLESHPADLVVMEACGPSGWISDVCKRRGLKTIVCSTNDEAWNWKNTKRKTDRDDAIKLARMVVLDTLTPVHVPSPEIRQQRMLIKYRKKLDGRINRIKNARHLSSYLGMTPKQYQSGETDRSGRISKRGPRMLRSLLLECAWASTRYNAWSKLTFARIHGGSKTRRKKAGIALARRLAVVAWAMMRDETNWDSTKLLPNVPETEVKLKVKRPNVRPAGELHSQQPKRPSRGGGTKRKRRGSARRSPVKT